MSNKRRLKTAKSSTYLHFLNCLPLLQSIFVKEELVQRALYRLYLNTQMFSLNLPLISRKFLWCLEVATSPPKPLLPYSPYSPLR